MSLKKLLTYTALRLSGFAAVAVICWIVGIDAHVGAASTLSLGSDLGSESLSALSQMQQDLPKNMQVLSPKDAELYRAAFAAQKHADWKTADLALANLTDKRLVGHVLADRYERRKPSALELRNWLATYGSLPEASDLYTEARKMPAIKGVKYKQPTVADAWTGSDQSGSFDGFKNADNRTKLAPAAKASAAKIEHDLRRNDPMAARAVLETEQAHRVITMGELGEMDGRIANGFFYHGDTDLARRVADEAAETGNPLALWIGGLSAWKQDDAPAAGAMFAKLAGSPHLASWDRAAASFWAYRALKRAGEEDEAHYWLAEAARQPRSFYGFLAAHLLGQDADKSWSMPPLSQSNIAALSRTQAGSRALALVQIGEPALAESELRHLNPQGRHDLQEAMLALAEKIHMPSLALQLGGLATHGNGSSYDAALYPLPPWQPEQGFKVDRALLYALIRHESQFDPEAVSNRGACGLMQLMPATANLVADEDDAPGNDCSGRLLEPAYNMALGQEYVRHLASQPIIGNNLLLLLTAYNSGPTKMARWLDNDTRNDPLLFVESMPVRETRDYVQQVLIHYWMYRARLAEPESSLTQLAHGEWPRFSLRDESPLSTHPKQAQAEGIETLASY